MPRSPTSAAAARSRKCARRFIPPPRLKGNDMRLNRRSFIIGSAGAAGGLALGLRLPFGPAVARAQDGSPEIGVWVAIAPDDSVNIRVVRSEMGRHDHRPRPARGRGARVQ